MTDNQLLCRLKAGQDDALEELIQKYRRYVCTIIVNVLGHAGRPSDVEELISDTFYAVWHHADAIQPGKLKAYLSVTARNRAKNHLRSLREPPMDLDTIDLPDTGHSLEETAMQAELARLVQQAIDRMRPKDREIFLRYYYYFQTTEEIARHMSIPSSTVRSRLIRGRKILKDFLSKEVTP